MKDVCWHTDTAKNLSLFDERELFVLFSRSRVSVNTNDKVVSTSHGKATSFPVFIRI